MTEPLRQLPLLVSKGGVDLERGLGEETEVEARSTYSNL